MDQFERFTALVGQDAVARLSNCRVAVFGIGGVGGYVVEALARSGLGALDLIDSDTVAISNLNRQIIALHSTIGQYKADVASARVKDISPACSVTAYKVFYSSETAYQFNMKNYDYIVDAVDSVSSKLLLVEEAKKADVPIISSMGAGNKLDPTRFEVVDIYKTSVCPLARVMRYELRKRGIKHLKVVYSREEPVKTYAIENGKSVPASSAFVPSAAGLIIAGEVVKDLCRIGTG